MFTYEYYIIILEALLDKGYSFENYEFEQSKKKNVILRHDIYFSLDKVL